LTAGAAAMITNNVPDERAEAAQDRSFDDSTDMAHRYPVHMTW
jgi:hypothetical protein